MCIITYSPKIVVVASLSKSRYFIFIAFILVIWCFLYFVDKITLAVTPFLIKSFVSALDSYKASYAFPVAPKEQNWVCSLNNLKIVLSPSFPS